jgi:hypothetical protein
LTSFDPMSPVPPITTIFIIVSSFLTKVFLSHQSFVFVKTDLSESL